MKHRLEHLIKFLYLPFFLLVGNGFAIALVTESYSLAWLILLGLLFVGISFLIESLLPYDIAFNLPMRDQKRDLLHATTNELLSISGLLFLPLFGGALTLVSLWPSDWPLWLQLLLAIAMADVGITLAHFASHRVTLLWRLHAVHHSVKRLYGFNGLMKHPLHQLIETVAGVTPLLIIGVPHEVLSLLVFAVLLQLLLQHSNVAYYSGPLKKILAINAVHRFHHLNNAAQGDVNFGLFTTLTDRLLGTAYFDEKRVIGSESLGIAEEPNYPQQYIAQLIQPFK